MSDNKKDVQKIKFEGEVRWATIPPRKPRGPHEDYTEDKNRDDLNYSIEVECSDKKFKALKKAGIPKLTELHEDKETGKKFLRLKASKVKTNLKGENYEFEDIRTYGPDGKPLTQSVANGSKGKVLATLEPSKKGKVLRLKAVMITDLIPYEDNNLTEEEIMSELGIENDLEDDLKDLEDDDDEDLEDIM